MCTAVLLVVLVGTSARQNLVLNLPLQMCVHTAVVAKFTTSSRYYLLVLVPTRYVRREALNRLL